MNLFTPILITALIMAGGLNAQALNSGSGESLTSQSRKSFFKSTDEMLLNKTQLSPEVTSLLRNKVIGDLLKEGRISFSTISADAFEYRALMDARALAFPDDAGAVLAKAGFPDQLSQAKLSVGFKLDKPWTEKAVYGGAIQTIKLEDLNVSLGPVNLTGTGDVDLDEKGKMQGSVNAVIKNWSKLMPLIQFKDDTQRSLIENALGLVATGETLSATFDIKDSVLMYGPIALTEIDFLKIGNGS